MDLCRRACKAAATRCNDADGDGVHPTVAKRSSVALTLSEHRREPSTQAHDRCCVKAPRQSKGAKRYMRR